jgi:molybdenum cofactor sulfurtransferase
MFVPPAVEPPALYRYVETDGYWTDEMRQAHQDFNNAYAVNEHSTAFALLRKKEFARLDSLKQIYLDYTGGCLYGESQLTSDRERLSNGVYGNPHSDNPTSALSTQLVYQTRSDVLRYFNASPDEYTVIFTANATGALKLIGESYPFEEGGRLLLTVDNHNSVNGIREFARTKGVKATYIPTLMPDMRVDENTLDAFFDQATPGKNNLFAYPAQSNFSGVQHSLAWISHAQEKGWDVLLDAAAFVPMNKLDLSIWHPDFIDLSFYKMFGYPTGIGCLIVKHTALAKLKKPWFSGGTIEVVSVQGDSYELRSGGEAFEDGTVNYLGIPAISTGLKYLETIGVEAVHEQVMALTDWLIKQLLALHHSNGKPLLVLYGPGNTAMRGATITINFFDPDGIMIDQDFVEQLAKESNISLRTGCFCNPGSLEVINGLQPGDLEKRCRCYAVHAAGKQGKEWGGVQYGAVRISLGLASNFADCYHFVQFARSFIDKKGQYCDRAQLGCSFLCNDFGC